MMIREREHTSNAVLPLSRITDFQTGDFTSVGSDAGVVCGVEIAGCVRGLTP